MMKADRIPDLDNASEDEQVAYLSFVVAAYMTPTVLIGPVGDSFDEGFMRMEHVALHKPDYFRYVSFSEELVWFY